MLLKLTQIMLLFKSQVELRRLIYMWQFVCTEFTSEIDRPNKPTEWLISYNDFLKFQRYSLNVAPKE